MNENKLQLQIFSNSEFESKIRGFMTENDPYVVGIDVAKALGYKNPPRDVNRHVDKEDRIVVNAKKWAQMASQSKTTVSVPPDFSSPRGLIMINESGIYSLIFGSKLPNAKKFKRWVTSEVLPSIRKTGEYKIKDDTNDQQLLLQQAVRKEGKLYRRECTDAIKQLCIYFNLVGTKEETITYGKYTNLVYRIIRVPKGIRDSFDAVTLMTIANMELIVADEIMRCLIQNLDKGQIYCAVSKRLITYAQTAMLQERIDNKLTLLGRPTT